MMPRAGRVAARQTAKVAPEQRYQAYSFPGPSLGWVSDQNLAMSQPGAAYILDNIFPLATSGILRRGIEVQADLNTSEVTTQLTGTVSLTVGSADCTGSGTAFTTELAEGSLVKVDGVNYTVATITDDDSLTFEEVAESAVSGEDAYLVEFETSPSVSSMFSYVLGGQAELYAATDEHIWDVTSAASSSPVYAVTSGDIITAQYTSSDGTRYVRGVNGADTPFVYDGSSFGTSPALTFAAPDEALTPDILDFTWVFKNRFFFIEAESLNAWYLAVGTVGGELTKFSLGGVFNLGGKLIFGGSWSLESGDGLSAMCVFATDQGEVAVYQGSDPSSTDTWSLVGVYVVGKPKGKRAFAKRGGDILIATDIGLVPLSAALQKEPNTIALSALSAPIENEWRDASARRGVDWSVQSWSAGQMLAVALPTAQDINQTPTWFVANARTNRWCRFTGWDASCTCEHQGFMYFGSPNGKVYLAMSGGTDDGAPFVGVYAPVFDQMSVAGRKTVSMVRTVRRTWPLPDEKVSVHGDFRITLPVSPDASPVQEAGQWGVAVWGDAVWGGVRSDKIYDNWQNVFGEGEAVTIAHQVTSGGSVPLDTEFIRTDVLFTVGEMQS